MSEVSAGERIEVDEWEWDLGAALVAWGHHPANAFIEAACEQQPYSPQEMIGPEDGADVEHIWVRRVQDDGDEVGWALCAEGHPEARALTVIKQ